MNNQRDTTVYNIVQFPYITILLNIGFIECNIDKICLTLSCKSLFTRFKDRLLFKWSSPCKVPNSENYKFKSLYRLKSYRQSYNISTNHQSYYFISSLRELEILNNNNNNNQDWEDELEEEFDYREWENIGRERAPFKRHTIIFTFNFNEYIPPNTIPKHILHIKFGMKFNQPIDKPDILPPRLQSLIMDCHEYQYNLTLDVLPSSLKVYKRPKYLPLDHKPQLNNGLEVFSLGSDQYVGGGILPSTLKCLILNRYTHRIKDGDIPAGIRNLQMNTREIIYRVSIPVHVEYIRFPFRCGKLKFDNLQHIRHVELFPVSKLNLLPPSVTYLDMNNDINTLVVIVTKGSKTYWHNYK